MTTRTDNIIRFPISPRLRLVQQMQHPDAFAKFTAMLKERTAARLRRRVRP